MTGVIVCDGCGLAAPASFPSVLRDPPVTPEQREIDLRGLGWLLTPENDLCPPCHRHHAKIADEVMGQ